MIRPKNRTTTARDIAEPDVVSIKAAVSTAFNLLSGNPRHEWPTAVSHKALVESYGADKVVVRVWLVVPEDVACTEETGRTLLSMADWMKSAVASAGVGRGAAIDARVVVDFLDDESEDIGDA